MHIVVKKSISSVEPLFKMCVIILGFKMKPSPSPCVGKRFLFFNVTLGMLTSVCLSALVCKNSLDPTKISLIMLLLFHNRLEKQEVLPWTFIFCIIWCICHICINMEAWWTANHFKISFKHLIIFAFGQFSQTDKRYIKIGLYSLVSVLV